MAWKKRVVSDVGCESEILRTLHQYNFRRPPRIVRDRYSLHINGILESGDVLTLHVDRLTGKGLGEPTISPCPPAELPDLLTVDFSRSTRGNLRTVKTDRANR